MVLLITSSEALSECALLSAAILGSGSIRKYSTYPVTAVVTTGHFWLPVQITRKQGIKLRFSQV